VGEECTIGSVATAISFMKEGCCLEEGFWASGPPGRLLCRILARFWLIYCIKDRR
jgi:hypothetical protein